MLIRKRTRTPNAFGKTDQIQHFKRWPEARLQGLPKGGREGELTGQGNWVTSALLGETGKRRLKFGHY